MRLVAFFAQTKTPRLQLTQRKFVMAGGFVVEGGALIRLMSALLVVAMLALLYLAEVVGCGDFGRDNALTV